MVLTFASVEELINCNILKALKPYSNWFCDDGSKFLVNRTATNVCVYFLISSVSQTKCTFIYFIRSLFYYSILIENPTRQDLHTKNKLAAR